MKVIDFNHPETPFREALPDHAERCNRRCYHCGAHFVLLKAEIMPEWRGGNTHYYYGCPKAKWKYEPWSWKTALSRIVKEFGLGYTLHDQVVYYGDNSLPSSIQWR